MHILILTNFYPPCNKGLGYMQLCEEVANGLRVKGHHITVLTSKYIDGVEPNYTYSVYRLLDIDPDYYCGKSPAAHFFLGRYDREQQAIQKLLKIVNEIHPDIIFIFHAIGLPRILLKTAEHLPNVRVVYYLAGYLPELPDEYIQYWQNKPVKWQARLFKGFLRIIALYVLDKEGKPVKLNYDNVICVSEYVRNRLISEKLIPTKSVVIHNGIDLTQFSPKNHLENQNRSSKIKCLVAGNIIVEKGIHTVIDAFAMLEARQKLDHFSLTILGDGDKVYQNHLIAKRDFYDLKNAINFCNHVPREQMSRILKEYDILIMPSEYQEPLARMMQEAMSVGLLVIGTTTGGSGELLVGDQTGLEFEPGDSHSLMIQLLRAHEEPDVMMRIIKAGQKAVIERFNIKRTIDQIEDYLIALG